MSMSQIHGQLHDETLFVSLLAATLLVIIVAGVLLYFTFKRSTTLSNNSHATQDAVHVHNAHKQAWRKEIDNIVQQYNQNELSQDQACAQLAAVARTYVSLLSGEDINTHTLGELSSLRLKWRNKKGADMLRQTIAALYPPEFADSEENEQARNTSVEQAAGWVFALLEGWNARGQR